MVCGRNDSKALIVCRGTFYDDKHLKCISGNLEEMQLSDIIKYNQSFLEKEIQPEMIYGKLKKRGITLYTDGKKIDSGIIIRSIIDNNHYVEFLNILKKEECSFILKRLQPCGKII